MLASVGWVEYHLVVDVIDQPISNLSNDPLLAIDRYLITVPDDDVPLGPRTPPKLDSVTDLHV